MMPKSNTQDPAPVKELKTKSKEVLGFTIDDEPTKADYIFINQLLVAHLSNREELRLLLKLANLIDIEINFLFGELKTTFDFYKKKTRVAIVASTSMKQSINIGALVTADVELQYFPKSKQKAAIEWLLAGDKLPTKV